MELKVFDPMDERAVRAWLARAPRKEIVAGAVYTARADGEERDVGIVLYVEEHTVAPSTERDPAPNVAPPRECR